ncbi:MAG: peptide chain release factor N(5)-glutamine methyltransferase [Spirochaetales bacterium]|nr:peptide chain release factor N(5)-glutamine methyltransferase [Spirochaetales bacterium]
MTALHEISIREALIRGSRLLTDSESPWLDACLLLGKELGWSREKLLASYPDVLDQKVYADYMELIEKRSQGYPVAYITGNKEFFGRDFHVREGILCPRPDTEILIEEALKHIEKRRYRRVHDLCTGSGCIGLTLALENPELSVSVSDISPVSRDVFEINRKNLGADTVPFTLTSLFEGLSGSLDLIVTNPPYLTTSETEERMDSSWKEPELALDGGNDGLDLIRTIIREAPALLTIEGMLMIEADPRQMEAMASLMEAAGFCRIERVRDLAGDERVILGSLS